jgi:hypothetical protein
MNRIVQYINDMFGIENETSAPILITLLTFLLSYTLIWFGQIYKNYKETKKLRTVFDVAVSRLIEQMKNQSKNFSLTSENLIFKNDLGFSFRRVQLFPINTFENIGYSKTIDIYILRHPLSNPFRRAKRTKKAKAINKLWEIIHSAQYWHEKAISDTAIFLESYNKFNDRRNDAMEEHNKFFLDMLDQVNGKQLPHEIASYIEQAVQIRESWIKQDERTRADVINGKLIQPLRELNRKHQANPFANHMNFTLLRADHEYTNQNNVLKFYQKQYQDYGIIFKNYSRIADICLKIMKGYC